MGDSSLRSALRATFVSCTFCVGVYFVVFTERMLRDLEAWRLQQWEVFVARHLSPVLVNHSLHTTGWKRRNGKDGSRRLPGVTNSTDGPLPPSKSDAECTCRQSHRYVPATSPSRLIIFPSPPCLGPHHWVLDWCFSHLCPILSSSGH